MSATHAEEPIERTIDGLREGLEAFNRRDIEGAMAPLHPDVELVPLRAVLEGGSYHGVDGLRKMLEDLGDDWERFSLRADEFVPIGTDRVLVMGTVSARGKASGVEVDYAAAWLCYLRAGKVVRVRFYSDREQALEAAGD